LPKQDRQLIRKIEAINLIPPQMIIVTEYGIDVPSNMLKMAYITIEMTVPICLKNEK
jgi:hypothetical protein